MPFPILWHRKSPFMTLGLLGNSNRCVCSHAAAHPYELICSHKVHAFWNILLFYAYPYSDRADGNSVVEIISASFTHGYTYGLTLECQSNALDTIRNQNQYWLYSNSKFVFFFSVLFACNISIFIMLDFQGIFQVRISYKTNGHHVG